MHISSLQLFRYLTFNLPKVHLATCLLSYHQEQSVYLTTLMTLLSDVALHMTVTIIVFFSYSSLCLFKTEHDLSNWADLWSQPKHRLRLCSSLCMTTVSWLRQLIRSPPRNNLHTEQTCLSFRVPRSVRKWDSGGNFSFLSVTGGIIGFQSQSFHWRSRCFLGPWFS